MMAGSVSERAAGLYEQLKQDAENHGYHLNPDKDFTMRLVEGLVVNEERYGYISCPCRIAAGQKGEDLDIICPCDYRDPDLSEHGQCYCALYVSEEIAGGSQEARSIPERRGSRSEPGEAAAGAGVAAPPLPVWRCKVCGYLAGREEPPDTCPICKADKERFERFM